MVASNYKEVTYMVTKVINIREAPNQWESDPNYVYCGRRGRGHDGYFGNPHPVGWCALCKTTHARGEAIKAFKADFDKRVGEDPVFLRAVWDLADKILVCFCKPNDCHCDVYVEFCEQQKKQGPVKVEYQCQKCGRWYPANKDCEVPHDGSLQLGL